MCAGLGLPDSGLVYDTRSTPSTESLH